MAPYLVYNISQGEAILSDMVIARDERTLYLSTDQQVREHPFYFKGGLWVFSESIFFPRFAEQQNNFFRDIIFFLQKNNF